MYVCRSLIQITNMKNFKSVTRAIRRGHLAVQVNSATGSIYLTRRTSTGKQTRLSAEKSSVVYNF